MACTKINYLYSYVLQHIVMFVAGCFDKCVFCNIFVAFVIISDYGIRKTCLGQIFLPQTD